jgi:hypothetical protein
MACCNENRAVCTMMFLENIMRKWRRSREVEGSITANPSGNFKKHINRMRDISYNIELVKKFASAKNWVMARNHLDFAHSDEERLYEDITERASRGVMPSHYNLIRLHSRMEILKEINDIAANFYVNSARGVTA